MRCGVFTAASKFGHRHSQRQPWIDASVFLNFIHDPMEGYMRCSLLAGVLVSPLLMLSLAGPGAAQAPETNRTSGPIVHENLAVYFIHGKSAPGKVPLTLEEAMTSGVVKVRETSNVNQLEIENLGDDEVFVQSGDIVKGGKQDRTLMVSLLLPPKSGAVPIASFCVEEGRWTARGREDGRNFSTASASVPSRELKLAMKAPMPAAPPNSDPTRAGALGSGAGLAEIGVRQRQVWESVRTTQGRLTSSLGAQVRSVQSASSLQLALENERLMDAQKGYINALKAAGESEDDIIGFAFAVNGNINSADVYPSNGLFRKMWSKLLTAGVIEAIGHKDEPAVAPPSSEAVQAFLAAAESGKSAEKALNAGARLETREAQNAFLFETARVPSPKAAASWVHRNYLAK
jgi:ARG and Rhodanese-Phosphatase-superfamily-associated Protein domain